MIVDSNFAAIRRITGGYDSLPPAGFWDSNKQFATIPTKFAVIIRLDANGVRRLATYLNRLCKQPLQTTTAS